MMLKKRTLWVVVTILGLLGMGGGCQREMQDPITDDSAYFPLQIGDYFVYQITLEEYVASNTSTKRIYELQEKINSSYLQNDQIVYLVEESVRQVGQHSWKLSGIHTVYRSLSEVVSQENNVPVVKLAFPITGSTYWNTNLYNAKPDTLLHYRDIRRTFTVGKLAFAKTISVVGENDSTLVDQTKYLRVYAQNIGLVYRENVLLAFCQSSPACISKGIIESGTKLRWELVDSNRLP